MAKGSLLKPIFPQLKKTNPVCICLWLVLICQSTYLPAQPTIQINDFTYFSALSSSAPGNTTLYTSEENEVINQLSSFSVPFAACIPVTANGCSLGDSLTYFSLKGGSGTVTYNPSGSTCNASPLAYSDYTGSFAAVSLVSGQCFSGFMRTGNADDYATIWIDANDNDLFEDNERILDNLKIGTTKKLYSIYIPTTMNTGNHRLRVRIIYAPYLPQFLTHPCNSYDRSETEDYLVNITSVAITRVVAPGIPGSCMDGSETTIGPGSNNNTALQSALVLLDSSNRYIAGIGPNGLNMGTVKASFFKNNSSVRTLFSGQYYIDRNLTVNIENGFSGTYDIRYYFLNTELGSLIAQPGSGVTSVFDLIGSRSIHNQCRDEFSGTATTNIPISFGSLSGDRYIDFSGIPDNSYSYFLHGGSIALTCCNSFICFSIFTNLCNPSFFPTTTNTLNYNSCTGMLNEQGIKYVSYLPDTVNITATVSGEFELAADPAAGFSNTISLDSGGGIFYVRRIAYSSGPQTGNILLEATRGARVVKKRVYLNHSFNTTAADLAGVPGGSVVSQTVSNPETGVLFTDPTFPCKLIAKLLPIGNSPVSSTTAKVWVENSVPLWGAIPYVARHYDIKTVLQGSVLSITLYFKQAEFDAFNEHPASALNLPMGPGDIAGKANLRVYRNAGTINEDNGLPYTYNGTPELIDPSDADIVWNASAGFWEVKFSVVNRPGGFIVATANTLNFCALGSFIIPAGTSGGVYQWQVNNGTGFTNILADGGNYNGVFSPKLTLSGLPTSFYGYKYRCLIDGTPSTEYDVKFVSYWQGNNSTGGWHAGANWFTCNAVPDQFTDVVIPTGRANYPVVSTNTTIRSLRNESTSSVTIQTGVVLTLIGQ
ncbi:MAG: GEVED domain-containing protein [Bacteroidetes bacterium]|nr:GEVED domain-containing protein [Bacteroidota bacterium]